MTRDPSRASRAISDRLRELSWSQAQLARKATIDPNTISDVMAAKVWPRLETQRRIEQAVGWAEGTIEAIADGKPAPAAESERTVNGSQPITHSGESPTVASAPPTALFNWLSQTERMGYSENQRAYIEAQAFAAALKAAAELDEASRKPGT